MCEIYVENISKCYQEKQIFSKFSYRFQRGSITCITGSSGIGKTTLLRILMGLEQADTGNVSTGVRYSVVFQEHRLLEYLSAYENVRFVQSNITYKEQIEQDLAYLLGDQNVHRKTSQLSGGMKRRVAIVRAMLADSDAVLLDEPFTGLDQQTKARVISYIQKKRKNRTMIIVTHDRSDIKALGAQECIIS